MKSLKWRIFIIWLSLKWIPRVNLGDYVWYAGKKYMVCNGVRSESWRLGDLDNGDEGCVSRAMVRKVWTLANVWHSFSSGHLFYMANWYAIWKQQGIKDWMKACQIW